MPARPSKLELVGRGSPLHLTLTFWTAPTDADRGFRLLNELFFVLRHPAIGGVGIAPDLGLIGDPHDEARCSLHLVQVHAADFSSILLDNSQ